jgi:hypothetical protein
VPHFGALYLTNQAELAHDPIGNVEALTWLYIFVNYGSHRISLDHERWGDEITLSVVVIRTESGIRVQTPMAVCHGARAEERRRVATERCHRLHVASPSANLNTERTPPPPHSRSLSSPPSRSGRAHRGGERRRHCHRSLLRARTSSPSHHRPLNPVHYSAIIPSTSVTRCLTGLCRGEGEFWFPPP